MRTLFQIIQQEFQKENDLVLASIVASSGSTPRGAGSRMLVGKKGRVAGTIGGGSVEYRAELMALDILEKKESCEHEFRLNRKDVENIGMICGGDVTGAGAACQGGTIRIHVSYYTAGRLCRRLDIPCIVTF